MSGTRANAGPGCRGPGRGRAGAGGRPIWVSAAALPAPAACPGARWPAQKAVRPRSGLGAGRMAQGLAATLQAGLTLGLLASLALSLREVQGRWG